MSDSTIYRLSKRLRKAQDITYRVTVDKVDDRKTIEAFPEAVNQALDAISEHLKTIRSQAQLVEVFKDREKERDEIMVGVTQELANISTVLGGEGQNLKILTHSDPIYIKGVIVESQDEALIKALKNLDEDEKSLFMDKLKKAGIL